ncbi:hypothetical protein OQJ19_06835 [Fluoribacter gormanii]|uniref:Uncharacterized protein n=1 Tax=Fluoribacter gormanii TaxID=464 RepID=A0A377GER5_9GAMM|nr:hypothetical protein [Fluoribacter gormanii]KTD01750.1 hypothetical protein Lgor_2127 [Fluoribacter gormanii]MCW8445162.1 hypothetical protein [Fluoribacter gormanii]MCW8470372.1 hypothetical protein [Fluoribacter gormanii]SIR80267.1 hypothetical protein SAMN05421777_12551 [Fluoribacter gormanii]STO23268.1 Uncharacterised protein [Fluoribacter gormanii]
MKEKRIIRPVQTITPDHKNARTSHRGIEKAGKKKMSFFGDYGSRQSVRNEMIKDGLDLMEIKKEQEQDRIARDDEAVRFKR